MPVQREALRRSKGRSGFGFFMQQGLMKTTTALSEYLDLTAAGEVTRMVTLAPNSFKRGWDLEAKKWGLPVESFVYAAGADYYNNAFAKRNYKHPPNLIVNYEAIRGHTTQEYIRKWVDGHGALIVADESIQISTYNSAQTKAAVEMAKDFEYRRILTGKPMKIGPHDYWSQLRFIGVTEGVFHAWRNTFCKMGGFKAKQVVGVRNEERLATILNEHTFTALKKDWWEGCPEKSYTTREYRLTDDLKMHYQNMHDEFVAFLRSGQLVTVDSAITKYIKLAQIQTGFIIDEDQKVHELVDPAGNPRLQLLQQVLNDETVGKVCIPYRHRYTYRLLFNNLTKYNPAAITGGMTPEAIEAEKHRFNTDPNCRIILLQTTSSKYGHTLIGGEGNDHCSTMIFFENTYSLDDRSQIEDRIHRMGQKWPCLYIDLAGTPVDARMAEALQNKEDIFQTVLKAMLS